MAEQETIFDRWAKERDITVEEMKAIISARIEKGWNDPDLEKRALWRIIPCEEEVRSFSQNIVLWNQTAYSYRRDF